MIVDREQLTKQIYEWNANRLDLFALTVPDPVVRFKTYKLLSCFICVLGSNFP
jgi:hypothetical protein